MYKTSLLLALTLPLFLTSEECGEPTDLTPSPTPTATITPADCVNPIDIERDGVTVQHFCSIQDAINAAQAGDEIHIRHAGRYLEHLAIENRHFLLIGDEHGVIIDGRNQSGSVIRISGAYTDITIQNVFVTGGRVFDESQKTEPTSSSVTYLSGGGIKITEGILHLIQTQIYENEVEFQGGGIYALGENTSLFLENTSIYNNSAERSAGGLYAEFARVDLQNVLIYGNYANFHAGGVNLLYSPETSILNSVIASNDCANTSWCAAGVGMTCYYSSVEIHNSILAYNIGDDDDIGIVDDGAESPSCTWNILYSDIYDTISSDIPFLSGENGNVSVEPSFQAYQNDIPIDFHLTGGSPLIDIGDPTISDPDGSRSDMGAYGGPLSDQWE